MDYNKDIEAAVAGLPKGLSTAQIMAAKMQAMFNAVLIEEGMDKAFVSFEDATTAATMGCAGILCNVAQQLCETAPSSGPPQKVLRTLLALTSLSASRLIGTRAHNHDDAVKFPTRQ